MNKKEFYQIYIPALEKAFKEDNQVKIPDPERYIINDEVRTEISIYIDEFSDDFLDKVGYYLDARTHNFPEIGGVDINKYRSDIISMIPVLKKKYDIE